MADNIQTDRVPFLLLGSDVAGFQQLGIPADIVERAGIERVSDREAREHYGIKGPGDMAGIVFPYFPPVNDNGHRWTARLRRDSPDIEDGRPKRKYMAPYGDHKHLYFVPGCAELAADVTVPIVLVEAEKSALALTAWAERVQQKLLPIAMGGCYGWRGRIGRTENAAGERVDEYGPMVDLNICRGGRRTYVLLDANCASNPSVQIARRDLVKQLRKQGADVRVLDLPPGDDVNGPDDYIAVKGDAAMLAVLEGAETGSTLLDDLVAYYTKYVRVSDDEYTVLACWVLHCHAFKAFSRTSYLNVTSATESCGKTQLLEVTELIVPEALVVSSTTSAVLARSIDTFHPVLLMDELDQLLAGDKDLLSAVLATINSGYKRSGCRLILEPQKGGGWTPRKLSTFSAKILSGISGLPAVTLSRCIPITMERMLPDDRVAEIDEFIIEPEAQKLHDRAKVWAQKNLQQLREARPDAPPALGHRQREVSRPLFAIGDVVGGEWPEKIRSAVVRLFAGRDAAPSHNIKIELLQDIKQAFGDLDRIWSKDLVNALVEMEDRPWGTWSKGKPITQNQLARQLSDFKVFSGSVRIGAETHKGYYAKQFESVWLRYPPHTAIQNGTTAQPASLLDETHFSKRHKDVSVPDAKCEKPASILECAVVSFTKPEDTPLPPEKGQQPLLPTVEPSPKPTEGTLYDRAVALAIAAGQVAVSMLVGSLGVTTGQAIRLIDRMEEEAIVGPADSAGPRKVLLPTANPGNGILPHAGKIKVVHGPEVVL